MGLISYLQKNSRALDMYLGVGCTILCLLWDFLFVGDYANRGLTMLLSVVELVRCDQTPMSLVVVETILYLDRIAHHPH